MPRPFADKDLKRVMTAETIVELADTVLSASQ
jgi:hypothetical protein